MLTNIDSDKYNALPNGFPKKENTLPAYRSQGGSNYFITGESELHLTQLDVQHLACSSIESTGFFA